MSTLSEEARFELVMGAAARERRNRPRHLVLLAAGLVLASAAACGLGARSWAAAGREARTALERQGAVRTQLQEFVELGAKAGPEHDPAGALSKVISTAERRAEAAGLAALKKPRQPDLVEVVGSLAYPWWKFEKVESPEAGPLIEWVRGVLDEIPGLRVQGVRLTLGPKGWTMDVTFGGVERVGGGT